MRKWLKEKNNQKGLLTGLATGGSVSLVMFFFKTEHFLIQALLAAYFSFVVASFLLYFMRNTRNSE